MSVWKRFALGALASSPALLIAGGVAAFGTGGNAPHPFAGGFQLAQNAEPEAPATEEAVATDEAAADEGPAEFTEAFLADPAHQESGKVVWEVCAGCHGSRAYPGKAPKLRPKRYTPDFVFDRVTNGYKKMPPWKDVFTKDERMDVVAYILSDDFSP